MDFTLPPDLAALRAKVRAFVDERVIPSEDAILAEDAQGREDRLRDLREAAKAAGLWTPHLPREYGGLGLGVSGMCALFREMGRSLVGAKVFNCDAPDQGNMELLRVAASTEVRDLWLRPLAAGEITSGFSMTEPAPGAGSDPSLLRTTAQRDGDHFVINGHKWYTTGGGRAAILIVLARTSAEPRTGATMFLVERGAPGVEFVRDIPCMAPAMLSHREAEMRYVNVRVPASAVLGNVGDGFALAQARLVPARLTHCMRWLGLADRALRLCIPYVTRRESFGRALAEHQAIQMMFAENAAAIHAGNLMTWHCATLLEEGREKEARPYSSMAKNHVARALCKVLDDAIQMHGGLGYSEDRPFALWYRVARASRLADGADEVHRMVVARDFLKGRLETLV